MKDTFLHAWVMIKASSATSISFLQKKTLQRELEGYMKDLWLLDYEPQTIETLALRDKKWRDFARNLIQSYSDDKAYCSTLFGFVPIKDAAVAEKIATEIMTVTVKYPSKFNLSNAFEPLKQVFCDVYCEMIEQGKDILLQQFPNA